MSVPHRKKKIRYKPASKQFLRVKAKTGDIFSSSFGKKPIDTAANLLAKHRLPLFGAQAQKKQSAPKQPKKYSKWPLIAFLGILAGVCELAPQPEMQPQEKDKATLAPDKHLFTSIFATLAAALSLIELKTFLDAQKQRPLKTQQGGKLSDWELYLKNLCKHKNLYQELTEKDIDHFFSLIDMSVFSPLTKQKFTHFIIQSAKQHPILAKTVRELTSLLTISYLKKSPQSEKETVCIGMFQYNDANQNQSISLRPDKLLSATFFHEFKHAIQAQNGTFKIADEAYQQIAMFLNEAQSHAYSLLLDESYPYNMLLQTSYMQEQQKSPHENKRRLLGRAENKLVGLLMNILIAADVENFMETNPLFQKAQLTQRAKNLLRLDIQTWRLAYDYKESFENTVPPARAVVQQLSSFFSIDTGCKINVDELWKPKKKITPPHLIDLKTPHTQTDTLINTQSRILFDTQHTKE